jgi:hypothetical protein
MTVHSVRAINGIVSAYESCYLSTMYFQRPRLFCTYWQIYTHFSLCNLYYITISDVYGVLFKVNTSST